MFKLIAGRALGRAATLLAAGVLAGCTLGPAYERPATDLPDDWRRPVGGAGESRSAAEFGERWWSLYADPVLERLIDEALAHNADATIAAARVL